ncbi:MAG: glutamate--tRNA ligase [Coriobacteriia bacterium]
MGVRVRFAPSPTGQLHIGSARTALYNWAFARRHSGTFILRIDDTDPERSTKENTDAILSALEWLGIDWDEGPGVGGEYGPYFQTERAHLYAEALEGLKATGKVYPCFCTVEDLARKREEQRAQGRDIGYDRTCRSLPAEVVGERISSGEPHVWRLAVPEARGDVVFRDYVRGEVRTASDLLDDMVLVRSDGTPTYNFATVVDDALMGITHVIRGEDHISNTPRQILVFEALGYDVPEYAHMSLTFGPDGKRLSKRHGATSVEAFREMGFLPDALVNYIALLGWSLDDKTTVFDRETLVENFSLDRLSPNPGVFDIEKLEWMNGVYIRQMPARVFAGLIIDGLREAGIDVGGIEPGSPEGLALAQLLQERVKRLDEIPEKAGFFFGESVTIDESARDKVLRKEGAGRALETALRVLAGVESWETSSIEEALREVPAETGVKPKIAFQAVRVAVTGSTVSPPLFETLELLGREKTLARIKDAIPEANG